MPLSDSKSTVLKKPTQLLAKEMADARQRITLGISIGAGIITTALLGIIFGGDLTASIRDILGISYFMSDIEGVYADCSLASNKQNKFCKGDFSSALKPETRPFSPRSIPGDSSAFTLYGN